MNLTVEGTVFVSTVALMAVLVGWCFTLGVWGFCKLFAWAPVNVTFNTTVYEAGTADSDPE